jgi:protein TonB
MNDSIEIRNRRIGLATTITLHALVLVLFYFMVAWKAPYPPAAEYGIELNIGFDEAGTGDIQPENLEANTPESQQQNVSAEPEKKADENALNPVPEDTKEPDKKITPVEENVVQQKVDETPKQIKVPETKPVVAEQAGKTTEGTRDKNAGAKGDENKNTSQGDDINAKGDKGNPNGSIDARALYGKQGGGSGGSSLDLVGWEWDSEPKPKENSNETGKIVFEIKVNEQGEIFSIKTLDKTVSPSVEKIYREAVEQVTFHPLSSNTRPASSSTGKITFIIRSR